MGRIVKVVLGALALICIAPPVLADDARSFIVQLSWRHQFQYAGHYLALERGYYHDVGLDVQLREVVPGVNPYLAVARGEADAGVGLTGTVMHHSAHGHGLFVTAVIAQNSPLCLLTRKDLGITRPEHLRGKRVMLNNRESSTEVEAMLRLHGLTFDDMQVLPHSFDNMDVLNGIADAMSAYFTDRPFFGSSEQDNTSAFIVSPRLYGVEFYGDCLFASQTTIEERAEDLNAFTEATLLGWRDAAADPEAAIAIILRDYPVQRDRASLQRESWHYLRQMDDKSIPIGTIHDRRLEHMSSVLKKTAMIPEEYDFNTLAWRYERQSSLGWIFLSLGGVVVLALVAVGVTVVRNRALQRSFEERGESLQRMTSFTDAILKNMPVLFSFKDHTGRYFDFNNEFRRLHKIPDDATSVKDTDLFDPEFAQRARLEDREILISGKGIEVIRQTRLGNEIRRFLTVKFPVQRPEEEGPCLAVLATDMTEHDRLQEQLNRSQKLEAVGRLAGGVAHDFNNILAVILGRCQLLQSVPGHSAAVSRGLDIISEASERAVRLTRQLLAIGRQSQTTVAAVNVSEIARSTLEMLRRLIGENITLVSHIAPDDCWVVGDASQIEQIVMNLVLNARDAMSKGGTITLSLSPISNQASPQCELVVSDDGVGMDQETLARVFEPFFTTKDLGGGTGLGLATVYTLVQSMNGDISMDSTPGKGTRVRILLPATQATLTTETLDNGAQAESPSMTVMVIEDQQDLLDMIRDVLSGRGHTVLGFSSPQSALKVAASRLEEIDVILSDVIMPGMNGPQLIEALQERGLKAPVIYMTGYADLDESKVGLQDAQVMTKPFSHADLLKHLSSASERARV